MILERGEGREHDRERNTDAREKHYALPLAHLLTRTEPETLVYGAMVPPSEPRRPGRDLPSCALSLSHGKAQNEIRSAAVAWRCLKPDSLSL